MDEGILRRPVLLIALSFACLGLLILFRPKSPIASSQPAISLAAACESGFAASYPCNNINLLSHISLAELGGGSGTDSWGWTDPRDGREYAIMLLSNGSAFVDVTNPASPIHVGTLPTHDLDIVWRDGKVYSNTAWIGSESPDHGIQVFDLMQLRDVTDPPVIFSADARYDGVGDSHNVVINEESGYAYLVGGGPGTEAGCASGLHMVDISNPFAPAFAGCFSADGYTHDAQCVIYKGPDSDYTGDEICFAFNTDTVTIVNVSDKSAPILISRSSYPGVSYTHQGWLTEDHAWLLVNDEQDERNNGHNTYTYIWDTSDLDAPVLHNIHSGSNSAIDHNLYIKGTTLYEANYRSGLRLLDTSSITAGTLTETAFFDTYPNDDNPSYDGAWNVYPFFESDTLIVSDIDAGLFMLRPTLEEGFALQVSPSRITICDDESHTPDLKIEKVGAFSETVTLAVYNVPTNMSIVPGVNSRLPGQATTLSLTSNNVASGTYSILLEGETPSRTVTTSLLVHQAAIASVPLLHSPANKSVAQYRRTTLGWQDVGADHYRVQISAESTFNNTLLDTTTHDTDLALDFDLADDTTYYWRVAAKNGCGTSSFSPAASFTTKAPPLTFGRTITIFANDAETDTQAWAYSGNWITSTLAPYSGTSAFAAAGSLSFGEHILTSPTMTLPTDQQSLVLTFWHSYDLEQASYGCMDAATVQLSNNNGASWQSLDQYIFGDPHTNPVGAIRNPLGETTRAWCDSSAGWRQVTIDLSAWAGDTVALRFHTGSNGSNQSAGWKIDNITLRGTSIEYVYLPIIFSPGAP